MVGLKIMGHAIIVPTIMSFWNRTRELAALGELDSGGGLAVIWGRRRIGKTRLLLEWSDRARGVYTVADQLAPCTSSLSRTSTAAARRADGSAGLGRRTR
jgi:hypothetical protein